MWHKIESIFIFSKQTSRGNFLFYIFFYNIMNNNLYDQRSVVTCEWSSNYNTHGFPLITLTSRIAHLAQARGNKAQVGPSIGCHKMFILLSGAGHILLATPPNFCLLIRAPRPHATGQSPTNLRASSAFLPKRRHGERAGFPRQQRRRRRPPSQGEGRRQPLPPIAAAAAQGRVRPLRRRCRSAAATGVDA